MKKAIYPHLASLLFERPLLMERRKLSVIINAIAPKIGASTFDDVTDDPIPMRERTSAPVIDGIAVIEIFGSLVKRSRGMSAESGLCSYEDLQMQIMEAATNPQVSGILLDIDSGGGEAGGCFDLSDLIYSVRQQTPVFAIADDNALSAAYAIASAADQLFVTQTGLVGSVGVIAVHCDQSSFDSKLGVKYTPITFGDRKNDFSPHEPMSDEATGILQADVNRTGEIFVATIARNRGVDAEAVRGTQAGLLNPDEAISLGFADEIGTRADALGALNDRIASGRRRSRLPMAVQRAAVAPTPSRDLKTLPAPASAEANSNEKEDTPVSDISVSADAQGTPPVQPESQPATTTAAAGPAQPAVNMTAAEIADLNELCAITGQPLALSGFLRRNMSFADARKELAQKRSEEGPAEIQSQVLADVGTKSGQDNPSRFVEATRRLINSMKGGRS